MVFVRIAIPSLVVVALYSLIQYCFLLPEPSGTFLLESKQDWHTDFSVNNVDAWQFDQGVLRLTKFNGQEKATLDFAELPRLSAKKSHIIEVELNGKFDHSAGSYIQGIGISARSDTSSIDIVLAVNESGDLLLLDENLKRLNGENSRINDYCEEQIQEASLKIIIYNRPDKLYLTGQLKNCIKSSRASRTISYEFMGNNIEIDKLSLVGYNGSNSAEKVGFKNLRVWKGQRIPD